MEEQSELTIPYFRQLWKTNINDLEIKCKRWETICMNDSVPDEVRGDIRTNIGLAKLLMNQKLKQFKGLIDDSEFNTGEKEITCLDLQGFWDMVYNEVVKIKTCFTRLEKCKNNKWEFDDVDSDKGQKKKVHVKKEITNNKSKPKDDSRNTHALAAKQRLAEAKKKMMAAQEQKKKQNFVEITEITKKVLNDSTIINSFDNKKLSDTKAITIGNKEQISPTKTDIMGTVILNKELKSTASLQESLAPSIRNKENILSDDSSIKSNSKSLSKSEENNEAPSSKKRVKKDYGKLQCITRSAKRALCQQNLPL